MPGTTRTLPEPADVVEAAKRIATFVRHTPVWTCHALNEVSGCQVFLKCESFQRTGAFKFRGATNVLAQLTPSERERGVVTHSSGNHAQGLALAARLHGVAATVVMPENASAPKRDATAGYGARIVTCKPTQESREQVVQQVLKETGAVLVPPYDDPRIVAGQGTAALELLDQVPGLEAVLAPVGGGGLLSGTALACLTRDPAPRVIGCEPAGADDAFQGLAKGVRVAQQTPRTIADGLRTTLGELTFAILSARRVPIVRVTEEEIVRALTFVWERTKLVIEPSSAVAVAPLLARPADLAGKKVGVIVSGGNADVRSWLAGLIAPAGKR